MKYLRKSNRVFHKLFKLLAFAHLSSGAALLGGTNTCPCIGIKGPANIRPNVQQTLIVTDPPVGSVITYSVANIAGNTGNIVSQAGAIATINQLGTYKAQVCFPLKITTPLTPSVKIQLDHQVLC